jgi:hypothetical protein
MNTEELRPLANIQLTPSLHYMPKAQLYHPSFQATFPFDMNPHNTESNDVPVPKTYHQYIHGCSMTTQITTQAIVGPRLPLFDPSHTN